MLALLAYIQADLPSICNETGLEKFLVSGSWSSSMIAEVFNEWDRCVGSHDFDRLDLIANYINVYHGTITNDESAPFGVDFHVIKKYKVDGLFEEHSMVKSHSLSAMRFLAKYNIILTVTCFEVDFSKDNYL